MSQSFGNYLHVNPLPLNLYHGLPASNDRFSTLYDRIEFYYSQSKPGWGSSDPVGLIQTNLKRNENVARGFLNALKAWCKENEYTQADMDRVNREVAARSLHAKA